jgi:hypothetical protein
MDYLDDVEQLTENQEASVASLRCYSPSVFTFGSESCELAANGASPGKTHFSFRIQSAVAAELRWVTRHS